MDELDDHFLDSFKWRERLKRTLLYPGDQSIDFTLPLQVSGGKSPIFFSLSREYLQ